MNKMFKNSTVLSSLRPINILREESVIRSLGMRVRITNLRYANLHWFRSSDDQLLARLDNTIDLFDTTIDLPNKVRRPRNQPSYEVAKTLIRPRNWNVSRL
jgi:hypothetical protein